MRCPICDYDAGKAIRSNNQNRYYFGQVVKILSNETGYTKDKMHEILKRKFLTEHHIIKGKQGQAVEVDINGSTQDLNTVQFEDLMSEIREWASLELSIVIPLPNEVLSEN